MSIKLLDEKRVYYKGEFLDPDFRRNPYFLVVYIGIIFFESSFPSWHCV